MTIERFTTTLFSTALVTTQDKVLLAVSGGSDSIAMLHMFGTVPKDLKLTMGVAHLNHGIRGTHADRDEELVKDMSRKLGLTCHTTKIDVPALAREKKLSLEDAARSARYTFFKELCDRHGYQKIALAHTRDDNTETIIMKLLRGTGLKGLSGIPPVRELSRTVTIIRPLLSSTKKELQAYCRQHKLRWHEDLTNKDTDLLRNNVRHKILPALKKINPNLEVTLQATSSVLRDEDDYLDMEALNILNLLTFKRSNKGIRLDIKKLLTHPKAIQRRVIRLATETIQGDLQDIYLPFIENFLDNELTTITLDNKGNLKVSKERL